MNARTFLVRLAFLWLVFAFRADLFAEGDVAVSDQATAAKSHPDDASAAAEKKKDPDHADNNSVADFDDVATPADAGSEKIVEKDRPATKEEKPATEKSKRKADPFRNLRKMKGMSVAVDGKSRQGNDRVRFMDDNKVPADLTVKGNAVTVFGDLAMDGEVMHDAVTVFGDSVINGTVHNNAVVVMGDLTLGPKAHVDGDVVIVGGEFHRDPGAFVGGETRSQSADEASDSFNAWWGKTVKLGRPLAIGAHLGWLWIATAFSVAFYALLALIFPRNVRNCGNKLVQQPGLTVLAAVLGILVLPVLFVLLCVTIIGIPVALLVLPISCLVAVLFGKAAVYGLVGRKISRDQLHPVLAMVVGVAVFIVLYLLPIIGLLLSVLVSMIGFGCVVLTLVTPSAKASAVSSPRSDVVPPAVDGAAMVPPTVPEVSFSPAAEAVAAPVNPPPLRLPPLISAATLPRAGFWIRVAAAFLDTVLIGVSIGVFEAFFHAFGFHPGEAFPVWVVAYSVIMWATKATTIGGVICGLRIVRLDDRRVDWSVAMVRALGGFLSFAVAGIGFIWVAFDDDRQSWHDKIAGTTIVRVPKGTPLI